MLATRYAPPVHLYGGLSAFDPLTLSPSIWLANRTIGNLYQSVDTSTPVTTDGNPIGRSSDISGNNNHATQSTTSSKPTYKTSIQNGLSVARLDGADSWVTTSNIVLTDFTIFIVAQYTTAIANGWAGATSGFSGIRFSVPGAIRFLNAADTIVTTNSFTTNTWYIAALKRASNALTGWKNGTDITTGTPTDSSTFTVSQIGSHGSNFFNGDIGEIIIFPSALSDSNMTNMFICLNALWAVY